VEIRGKGDVMDARRLDRRALLLGAAGTALVAGCGDGSGTAKKAKSSGPIIRSQDPGTVIATDDIKGLVTRLNAALRDGDVAGMRSVIPDLDVREWRSRLRSMRNFPLEDLGFVFEDSSDRQVNASGGPLDINVNVVLTHRIKGCDSRVVVQPYSARLTKQDKDAEVRAESFSGPAEDDAPWDLPGTWDVIEGKHVVVAARDSRLPLLKGYLGAIDEGAAAAMQIVAPAGGISKMSITVAEENSTVFGGLDMDRTGFAARMTYIDPEVAAREGVKARKDSDAFATSRIVLRPTVFTSQSYVRETALHESIHGLALKWGFAPGSWIAEGLATWADSGLAAGYRRSSNAGLAKAGFSAFRRRFLGFRATDDYDLFQRQDAHTVQTNYACSGAVYACIDDTEGRARALELGRLLYGEPLVTAMQKFGEGSQDKLFGKVEQWVNGL
jgi:hypothetical protein